MKYSIAEVQEFDGLALAELRVIAMKEGLKAIGRFDPVRARERFLNNFSPKDTWKIVVEEKVAGFFSITQKEDHLYLDHLYIHPEYQNKNIGSRVLKGILDSAKLLKLPVRLGALKNSQSNQFYLAHGFSVTHREEWDVYYEFAAV